MGSTTIVGSGSSKSSSVDCWRTRSVEVESEVVQFNKGSGFPLAWKKPVWLGRDYPRRGQANVYDECKVDY